MAGSKADAASRARLERMRELLADEREPRLKRTSSEYGKSLRKAVPRDVFSFWQPPLGRSNGADLVFQQDLACEPWLVEIRHARMAANPFAFYRGAAVVMAQDLQSLPTTGVEVQAVGDAHIANFGLFRSPDGHSVFDVRDFEETTRAPWEWDVARLAASVEICGRASGLSERQRDEAKESYENALSSLNAELSGLREKLENLTEEYANAVETYEERIAGMVLLPEESNETETKEEDDLLSIDLDEEEDRPESEYKKMYFSMKMRYNGLRRQTGRMPLQEDYSTPEGIQELETELSYFMEFFDEEWKKAKKNIRKKYLWTKKIRKVEAEDVPASPQTTDNHDKTDNTPPES
jgi:hypothetical protein